MATNELKYKIGADSTSFRNELQKASTAFDRFGKKHSKVISGLKTAGIGAASGIAALGTAAATAAVALSVKATRAAAGFERAIVSAGAKAGATARDLKQMEQAAIKAAAGAEFSARQAADAMGFLAAAGFSVREQMAALPGVLNLASAGELELAAAADFASNILSGFGLKVEELGRVNDVLVKGANSSNTSVTQLGEALSYAAPAAAGAGFTIEETVAAIGKLSDAGIQAGRAGTSFNQILAQMSRAADKLGIQLSGADIKQRGFAKSLHKLTAAGLTAQNAGDFFTERAKIGLQALLVQGIPTVEALTEALENAGGTAQEVADKKINTLTGALNILEGNIDNLLIMAGQKFVPGITDMAKVSSELADRVRENDQMLQQFANTMADLFSVAAGLGRALGGVAQVGLYALGALSGNLSEARQASEKLGKAVDSITNAMTDFAAKTKAGTSGLTDLEQELVRVDAALRSGNLSIQDRIKLTKEFNRLDKETTIERLKDQAGQAESLQAEQDALYDRLGKVEQAKRELERIANRSGLNLEAMSSLAPLPDDMTMRQRDQVEQFRQAWQEVNYELSKTRTNLDDVERSLRAAYDADNRLINMGVILKDDDAPKAAVKLPTPSPAGIRKQAKDDSDLYVTEFVGGFTQDVTVPIRVAGGLGGMIAKQMEAAAKESAKGVATIRAIAVPRIEDDELDAIIEKHRQVAEQWTQIWENAGYRAASVLADSVGEGFLGALEGNIDRVRSAVKGLIAQMIMLAAKAAILRAVGPGEGAGKLAGVLGFASGGYVSGPGTSTSDSIPARLSDGEYVVKSSAVSHWGVGFMEAINNMRIPANSRPQKFATGGLATGGSGGGDVYVANLVSEKLLEEFMLSARGETVMLNVIERNSKKFSAVMK